MLNSAVYNYFISHLPSIWRSQNNGEDCCILDIRATKKNQARSRFGVGYQEEILFLRDTSFWDTADQGLLLTDGGLYCIPDNENSDSRFVFGWEIIKEVRYRDAALYFYGYDSSEGTYKINMSFFIKNQNDFLYDNIGPSIATFLTDVVSCIDHIDPFHENLSKVDNLLEKGETDDAISFLKSLIAQEDDDENMAWWYVNLALIADNNVKYCNDGLKYCEDGDRASIELRNSHRNGLFNQYKEEIKELQGPSQIMSMPNVKLQRWEGLWVSQHATDETYDSGTTYAEDACTDFEDANKNYCLYFTRQPYNERKVLLVVKDYTDLRQESLSIMKKSDIPSNMSFPIGHPQEGQIYVGHPFIPTKYVPVEEYQLEFIEDKVREFTWLMQCMGATKISISTRNGNEQKSNCKNKENFSGDLEHTFAMANCSYRSNAKNSFAEQISKKISLNQNFKPIKAPYIPDGLVWYQNEPSWQRLVKQRMTGSLLHASESIETRKSNMVNGKELKTIKAEFQSLISVDGEWTKEEESKFQQQENAILTFEIDFAPIESLKSIANPESETIISSPVCISVSSDEQEYINELKECLADGEIGSSERRLLNRLATKLGISSERAVELEESLLAPQLTANEKEYLEEYRIVAVDGVISEKERRLLEKLRKMYGISEERVKEIETSI